MYQTTYGDRSLNARRNSTGKSLLAQLFGSTPLSIFLRALAARPQVKA